MDANAELEHPRWVHMWNEGIAPGQKFDMGLVSPYLQSLIQTGSIPNGRALVPGCGRGYDVTALASHKRTAIGIDLSPIAINEAIERLDRLSVPPPPGSAQFICGSFFELPSDPSSQFNFIYDYTFLCALDPSVREKWASKLSELTVPGGEVLTLIFPIREYEGGPPFSVSLELVRSLMEPAGFECIELKILPPEMSHSGRDGSGASGAFSGTGRWKKL